MAFGGRMHLSIWRKPPRPPRAPRLPQKGDESGQISSASHGPRTATPQGTQARGVLLARESQMRGQQARDIMSSPEASSGASSSRPYPLQSPDPFSALR